MNKLSAWIRSNHEYDFSSNQMYFILNGVLSQGFNVLTLGVFLTGYALWLGATDAQAGMILSIIYMANIFQLLIVNWWHGVKKEKKAIISVVTVSRLILSVMIIIPFIHEEAFEVNVPVFGVMNGQVLFFYSIVIIGMFFGSSSGIKLNLWMMSHLPRHMRGNFFTARNRATMIVAMILSISAGRFLDYMTGRGFEYKGFFSVFMIGAIFALMDALVLKKIDFDEIDLFIRKKQGKENALWIPLKDGHFRKVLLYQALFMVGINLTIPFLNVYMLQQLEVSYSLVTGLLVVQMLISSYVIKYWGKFANKHRWVAILNLSLLLFLVQMVVWLFIGPSTLIWLPVVFIMAGFFGPAYNMSTFNLPYSHLKKEQETAYMSVNTTIVSTAGMIGVILGGKLIQGSGKLMDITGHYLELNILVSVSLLVLAALFGQFGIEKIERNE